MSKEIEKLIRNLPDAKPVAKLIMLENRVSELEQQLKETQEKLKHEFDAGYKLGIKEGIAALDKIKEKL